MDGTKLHGHMAKTKSFLVRSCIIETDSGLSHTYKFKNRGILKFRIQPSPTINKRVDSIKRIHTSFVNLYRQNKNGEHQSLSMVDSDRHLIGLHRLALLLVVAMALVVVGIPAS
jgi:hypothetical protein